MENEVYEVLNKLNINFQTIEHQPVFTGDDVAENINIDGIYCKSLFIRNKNKSNYYLLSLPIDVRPDLKLLEQDLFETRLSFGNEEVLQSKLNITYGSVSLLNIIGVGRTDVKFIIDKSILGVKIVGFPPNINTASVLFAPTDIHKIMEHYEADYEFINVKKLSKKL